MNIEVTNKLINSLSMNEKRYFKLFINKNIFGSQNKYLLLFDIFNNNNNITEDLIKNQFVKYKFSDKNISYDMNYLNKMILRSLNEFHFDKTINLQLQNNLKSIEILFYKGLYEECLKIIQKSKKLSLKNENEILILELLQWEKKCMGYSKGFYGALTVNEKIDTYFNYIKINKEITDLYYNSYFLKNNVGKISIDIIQIEFEKIINNSILKKPIDKLNSTQAKMYVNLIFANYYHVIKNISKELDFLEKTINILDKNTYFKEENPLDYISVYTRIIDIYKKSDNETFYKKIIDLRSFDKILDFQKNVANERIFFHTYQAELDFLIYNNNFEKATNMLQEINFKIKENKFKLEPYYFIGIYYQFACIMFYNKNLSQALKFINHILNEFNFNDRPKSYIKTELLNILIHYELKNYQFVIHLLSNFKKKYSKTFKINKLEQKIIKTISVISENPLSKNERNEFKNLSKKIEKLDIEKTTSNIIYLKYLENKIKT